MARYLYFARPVHLARSCHGYLTFLRARTIPYGLKVISHSRQNSPRVLAVRMNVSRNFLPGMDMPNHDN
jgi:hypothetical protein